MNDKIDSLAYCAGYIDGDGCFYVGKTLQKKTNTIVYEYSIQIISIKREVLDIFCSYFGGFVRQKTKRIKHKIPYQWTIKGKNALQLAIIISDILVDKKIACSLFIDMSKTIFPNAGKKVSDQLINERDEIINKIRKDREMHDITKEQIDDLKNRKNIIEPTPRDYAYLAGLIDSEGCFRVKHWLPKNKPNHVYTIHLEIGNTKLPIMPWLIERFGGGITFVPAKPNKKSCAIWSLSSKALYQILPKIYPFLTNKKAVCEKLIEFQQTILPNGGDRHSELFNALFTKNRELRDKIVSEIHQLNLKGSN